MAAEAAISAAVRLLGDLLIQEVNFLLGVEGKVRLLKEELTRMQSFLRDANEKRVRDERVRNWISDIKDLALDVEDTFKTFSLNVENPRESRGFFKRCVCFPKHVHHLDNIGKEIDSIRARLDAIRISRDTYGIKDLGESSAAGRSEEVEGRRRLSPWEKDEHLVGLEDDVKKLLEQVMDEKKGFSVAAVVGMGGIGKSTLAREVYNHPDVVSGRFDCRAWVVVSSEFSPLETIKQLILETTSSEQDKQQLRREIKQLEEESTRDKLYHERKLKELLHKRLLGKTYFVVLDDVWKKEHWDLLMSAFPKEEDKSSRLLLTTRNNVIANQSQNFHEMKFLDPEKSWELFLKKGITGNSNGIFPKELEQKGRQIVKKCNGLPLAITVMGGLLVETRSNREWEEALNELNSHLEKAKNSVSAILELSYQNLSPQLKYCFLCLAFFKEDAAISVKRLINIMVGQGLIQQTPRTTVEEVARGYLDELINRNVVLVKELTLDNRVKSCHLHDSLQNICLEKAEEEIGLEILMGDRGKSEERGLEILMGDRGKSLRKPRHRIVQSNDLGSLSMNNNKHIRSLFLLNRDPSFGEIKSSYWKSFQHLSILDLDCCYPLSKLPADFRLLLGLEQLRIRTEHKRFIELPTWLSTLKKLEILDMRTELVEFPEVALEMDSLRHIYINCVHGPMMAANWNVETLKYIRQKDWMGNSLRRMINNGHLRELGIILQHDSGIGMVRESIGMLENLVKLYLVGDSDHPIDAMIIPPLRNLTKLKLRGRMRACPSASILPPNLSHLTLEISLLREDPMEELGKLPNLSYLKLKDDSYIGETMEVLQGGFPSLKCLSLRDLSFLRSLDIKEGGMPQLKLVQVYHCPTLDTKNLLNRSYQLQFLNKTI